MNLHVKLFLPALLLVAAISATMHFYWLPNYKTIEIKEQQKQETAFADILGTALVPDLINNDIAKTHATLDRVLESRQYWHSIKLIDRDQQVIYPLFEPDLQDDIKLEVLEHNIIFNGNLIARLQIGIDINASSAQRLDHIYQLEKLFLLTLLFAGVIAALLQDKWIKSPLRQLSMFASEIAHGNYNLTMKYRSRDEVGELVDAFTSMGQQIQSRESDLIESQARNKAVIDNAVDGIISIDVKGKIESFNPAAERIFGYTRDEVIGENVKILMPQPYKREHDGYLYNYLSTGKQKIIGIGREVTGLKKDGTSFPLDLAVSEIKLKDRRLFIGITRDISERKKIEQMKSEFVSTVSHELRTPLTSIRGALSLVIGKAGRDLPPKIQRMLETANRNSERLTYLINDILDLEKINAGKLEFQIEPVNLKSLIKRALDDNEVYAHSHSVRFNLDFEADESTIVRVDEQRMLQVLANLISNAVKYSPENDFVGINVCAHNGQIRISVIDNGPGISDEFRSRIFGRFAQADSSDTREKGGTGLGLTITKAIVEQLGGRIGFNSEPGNGAEFFVDLTAWEHAVEATITDKSRARVLVCEDDPDVAYILVNLLESEGFSGDIAGDAQSARDMIKKNNYSLLLLDLMLPDSNGLELVSELKSDEQTRKLPIIIVSGRANEGRKDFSGDAVTVADWLQKPIDRERLSHAVEQALHGSHRPHILHVEDDVDVIQVSQMLFEDHVDFDYASTLKDAEAKIVNNNYDLIIVDISLPDGSGLDLLDHVNSDCPIVLFSGQESDADINNRVAASLTKSRASNEELIHTVKRLLANNQ